MPTALQKLLNSYRKYSKTEREKGARFEKLVKTYLLHEPSYKDLFGGQVYLWEEWRQQWRRQGNPDPGPDAGIDLVAVQDVATAPDIYAIQAKFYAEGARVSKGDMDSFLSSMGRQPFTRGILCITSTEGSIHAQNAVTGRDKPVNIITQSNLEDSQIDWSRYQPESRPAMLNKKSLLPHQETAVKDVIKGLKEADRGKMIMACGTGKTYTSLKIAEKIAGRDGQVLFLVPSLALLSQTLTEWTQESGIPLHSFAVCSDSEVGRKRKNSDDEDVQMLMHELRYPATTKPTTLAREVKKRHDNKHISVVYGTYHSIDVISQAQKKHKLPEFDLIICDEAHRTTGATWEGDDESHFVKVHKASFIKARKRLYMTATPRIYGDSARAQQEQGDVTLYSMDDESKFGKQLHILSFTESVRRNLLCDYKVIVLTVSSEHISRRLQNLLKDENNSLKVDDAAKIVGCWKALAKIGLNEEVEDDSKPMRRAVAFCQVIEAQHKGRTHKVSSKQIAGMFQEVVETYQESEINKGHDHGTLTCEAEHIDGTMNAGQKEQKINWLKEETLYSNTCRILSNVRCLGEGVDVPALDAVLFLTPRNSQMDVVQAVGRVMRNAQGKKRGYVILPVVIPEGVEPHKALDDNRTYKVVWEVLQALRSHDDSFDAHINKLDITGVNPDKMEVVAVTDEVQPRQQPNRKGRTTQARDQYTIGGLSNLVPPKKQYTIPFEPGELERALYAKIVKKCGNRYYWEQWAGDIANIAQTHITRIRTIVNNQNNKKEVKAFKAFTEELRDDLNDSITEEEVIEMLAQHLITRPVFDALFEGHSFTNNNPVSQAMQKVLNVLQEHRLEKEADTLEQFYESVRMRAEGIDNAEGKQKIINELYDKFFRNAFPRMTERLGIVYTPTEVVDFIIHSINDLLQQEFKETLGSKGVHILDPFTGTGTFITRLLQSKLINKEQIQHKYNKEIHANEIVLLAYYIAAINIEATYHAIMNEDNKDNENENTNNKDKNENKNNQNKQNKQEYQPFTGICLTDTFQMYEKDDLISELMEDNSDRRKRQKKLDIRVIMGNPPYSAKQGSANDNNPNIQYPTLDDRIRNTYAAGTTAINKNALYDSYIRSIRWASDRLCKNRFNSSVHFQKSECAKKCQCNGVIGFVTNAGFLESNSADSLRKCLVEEFSSIYVFHLRGNARTQGEQRRKEKDNVFGVGSRAPVAISLLVKNPKAKKRGQIFFHDIGDYLTCEEKLEKISAFSSVKNIKDANKWKPIVPDKYGDWFDQRDDTFYNHILMGDKKGRSILMFENFSRGLGTSRDAWCYNASQTQVAQNMQRMIKFYNSEVRRYKRLKSNEQDGFIANTDSTKIAWSSSLLLKLERYVMGAFTQEALVQGVYRPFQKQWCYFDKMFNHETGQIPRIFPEGDRSENLVIMITAKGAHNFSCTISNIIPDLNSMAAGTQCFPLYLYENAEDYQNNTDESEDMFAEEYAQDEDGYTWQDGITDGGLQHFQKAYPGKKITKEDIFYYIYGLLHSPQYRERYADNLIREMPRIPCVKKAEGFRSFSKAGRDLAHWHLNYETVKPYNATVEETGSKPRTRADKEEYYYVTKMKHPKLKDDEGKNINDLTTVIYNDHITVKDIPVEAYDYVVNGKPAIEWVIDRQCVKTDKASGIINDANDWANETMNNPKYPLELLLRVITVSLETNKIVSKLPPLDID